MRLFQVQSQRFGVKQSPGMRPINLLLQQAWGRSAEELYQKGRVQSRVKHDAMNRLYKRRKEEEACRPWSPLDDSKVLCLSGAGFKSTRLHTRVVTVYYYVDTNAVTLCGIHIYLTNFTYRIHLSNSVELHKKVTNRWEGKTLCLSEPFCHHDSLLFVMILYYS